MLTDAGEETIDSHPGDFTASAGEHRDATEIPSGQHSSSVSNVLSDPVNYTEPRTTSAKESGTKGRPPVNPVASAHPSHHSPRTSHPSTTRPYHSIADPALDNVTYDAILAASAKRLEIESNAASSLSTPAAPPNSPTFSTAGLRFSDKGSYEDRGM